MPDGNSTRPARSGRGVLPEGHQLCGQHPGALRCPGVCTLPSPLPSTAGADQGTRHCPSSWAWVCSSRMLAGQEGLGTSRTGGMEGPPCLGKETPAHPACAAIRQHPSHQREFQADVQNIKSQGLDGLWERLDPPLPQILPGCWGALRGAPPLSSPIGIQHNLLPAAERSGRSLCLPTAALSIPSLYKVCFIQGYSVTLIPAPLTSRRDPRAAGEAAPLEVLITPAQLQDLCSSAWSCILHFLVVSSTSQDYFESLPKIILNHFPDRLGFGALSLSTSPLQS